MQAELGELLRDSDPDLGAAVLWAGGGRRRREKETERRKRMLTSVIEIMNETCFNISEELNKYLNCLSSLFFSLLFLRRGGTGIFSNSIEL